MRFLFVAIIAAAAMRQGIGVSLSSPARSAGGLKLNTSFQIVAAGCPSEQTPEVPSSVHMLRPGDVAVVAALGDAGVAGFGALSRSIFDLYTDWRGASFATGGDGDISTLVTLPNILRSAGARALGRSTGSNPSGLPPGSGSDAGFNVAASTAAAAQIVNQARSLIIDLKSSREINFVEDWKVVTIWIGTNDLCAMCDDNPLNRPAEYIKYLEQTLDVFERDVPRAYVNVVPVFDVTKIADVNTGLCDLWHNQFCACGTSANPDERALVRAAAAEMQRLTAALVAERKYHDSADFTVELQPFLESTEIPRSGDGKPNAAYFAPDCFHWSKLGQELIAKGTWNNMMQPPDAKSLSIAPGDELLCPSNDRPYICTLTNNCGARPLPANAEHSAAAEQR